MLNILDALRNISGMCKQGTRKKNKVRDAQLLIEHFEEMKYINECFFYKYEVDDEGKLKHYFWADGIARKNYHHLLKLTIICRLHFWVCFSSR